MRPTTWIEMAALLDYADLRVDTREKDLLLLCLEADKYKIPTVLVNPVNVTLAKQFTRGLDVQVAGAISYPVGAYFPDVKGQEIEDAIADGADQIYMVMAVGAFIDGWLDQQTIPEFEILVKKAEGRPTKLVTEVSVLSDEQRWIICDLAMEAGIDYIVTTTDFDRSNLPPVSVDDIEFLVNYVHGDLQVIHKNNFDSLEIAQACLKVGAAGLCTENAREILQQYVDFPFARTIHR